MIISRVVVNFSQASSSFVNFLPQTHDKGSELRILSIAFLEIDGGILSSSKSTAIYIRDPKGIRPLVIGERQGPTRTEYIIASENASFSALGFNTLRDVKPGEAVFIDVKGNLHSQQCADNPQSTPCIFEYVYFLRGNSKADGYLADDVRYQFGIELGKQEILDNPKMISYFGVYVSFV